MKTKRIVLAILIVFMVVLLTNCAPKQEGVTEDEYYISDPACPDGMIVSRYTINREYVDQPSDSWKYGHMTNIQIYIFHLGMEGFILRPSKGCNLPAQSCIVIGHEGLSCSPLDE